MNTSQLKDYAPEARRAFIAAVSAKAARLGITAQGNAHAEVQGDVLLVGGQAFPKAVASGRKKLVGRVEAHGFDATMEAIAYTWFNRFAAIRFMELHGYLDHGYRVLSHQEGSGRPEILDHAADVDLPGLDREKAVELKLDGTKDEELYRLLLKAQCNALHQAMPFLFEKIGDETELLLPANLLHTDSLIRQLVKQVDEDLWQEIEIIGWIYQFYISEKKDQVIGKVVKSEDIPAATQLFTPNWIVKYMVQNSLGAQWLATYPQSPLKGQVEYYIEPAEQTDEVKVQLAAITPSTLNPEELTLIDPASGSGHILVEAYELLKAIYLERGYRQRDVAQLILEKNLFGLDIDERAAQLTGFALMMKGRADDRRLFERGVKLNVMALVDSTGFDAEVLAKGVGVANYGLEPGDLTALKGLFAHATTFGSLIQVPDGLANKLPALRQLSGATSPDMFVSASLTRLETLVRQAELLAAQYDAVVANPPYMGVKYMASTLKRFVKRLYANSSDNLCGCFVQRCLNLTSATRRTSVVALQNWLFQSSFEQLRENVLRQGVFESLVQVGFNSFPTLNSKIALAAAFTIRRAVIPGFSGIYYNCNAAPHAADKQGVFEEKLAGAEHFVRKQESFSELPGSPISYWSSAEVREAFKRGKPISTVAQARQGLSTSDNPRYVRHWHEVDFARITFDIEDSARAAEQARKWVPYNKGGRARRWYGNNDFVVDWANGGMEIKSLSGSAVRNEEYYFRPSITWSDITITTAFRQQDPGFVFANSAHSAFPEDPIDTQTILGLLNSSVVQEFVGALTQTLHFDVGYYNSLPLPKELPNEQMAPLVEELVHVYRDNWNDRERSWAFAWNPMLWRVGAEGNLEECCLEYLRQCRERHEVVRDIEPEVDAIARLAYGLRGAMPSGVGTVPSLLASPTTSLALTDLLSYAIGCMMGRYSLDAPGLIYAHSAGEGFDPSRYTTFAADDDGIVPLTDTEWFDDDAAHRLIEFISVAWDAAHLEDNLTFLADNLSPKRNESSRDTIRRYLCDKFFKDHIQKARYNKRPIYWLFSSGKQKAFQCLVYLHRYNEGTLSRMRSEYVIPLQGKMAARIEQLTADIQAAASTAHRKRLEKEHAKLEKQQVELLAFDEKLRHYADERITLDLDDGVKVNYGKFGDLLAEVKAVHGKKPEDV